MAIGKDIPHDSAVTHVTGESVFLDDLQPMAGELVADIFPSAVAHGVLKRIDLTAALAVPGIVAILTAGDIHEGGGHNRFGPAVQDEDLLVELGGEIMFLGHPLALIAGTTREAVEAAKKAIRAEVEERAPVLTIEQAMEAGSYWGKERRMERGDLAGAFKDSPHVMEGVLEIGGQEHFYLETQVAIAVPGEQRTMTIHSSTQHPTEVQSLVGEVLGVPFNHVTCLCKRMGGGFGGKETQAAQPAMMAALLAAKTGRPVRFVYNRDDDMAYTGKRHPFKVFYKAAYAESGRLLGVDLELYSNGGSSTDLSFAVLERAMLHVDNAYFLPAVRVVGRVCRTHLPSNTAFRGFGGPQGIAAIENILEAIAIGLKKDAAEVRKVNLYSDPDPAIHNHTPPQPEGPSAATLATRNTVPVPAAAHAPSAALHPVTRNVTHYGQIVKNNTLPRLFQELVVGADYAERRKAVDAFNKSSRTQVKGMALSPVKFGISFTRRTLNQANALVNIYLDGSVTVSTGATEMGQGVHTRIRQIVAHELGLTLDRVLVGTTSTDKNNNTSPTAASTGTDLNGAAAADACARLRGRLAEVAAGMLASPADGLAAEPAAIRFEGNVVFDARSPDTKLPFPKLVAKAYELRVSLGERGFYVTPGVDFNRETGRGTPFLYYTAGAALAEVVVDRFTGQLTATRVDVLMDTGIPLNPGIDRGQITGGFIQGMGWCTTEELLYSTKGALLTHSPDTYKIPAISDVPEVFNVNFLNNPDSVPSLYRSKSVGEPPLVLGLSVWLAAKNAVSYVNPKGAAGMNLPATGEQILRAMGLPARSAAPRVTAAAALGG